MSGRHRPVWPALALLVLLGSLARVIAASVLAGDLRIQEPVLDARYYLELAQRLARGDGWPAGPIFMTPLYPSILAVWFRFRGDPLATVQIFQSILGLGTLLLLYASARRDFGRTAAWCAAILYLLCGPVLAMESQILTETLLLFLAALALWLWPGADRSLRTGFLFGLVCGLLVMGRGVFVLLPIVPLASVWIRRRIRGKGRPEVSRPPSAGGRAILVLVGVLVALLPLSVHQTRTTGRLQILTLNGGLNLYLGNNPWARGLYSAPPGIDLEKDITAARSASLRLGRRLTLAESDRFYRERALEFSRSEPVRALWLFGRKALLYLSPHEIPQIEHFAGLRREAWPLRVAFVDFRWILPLAGFGLVGLWSGRRQSRSRAGRSASESARADARLRDFSPGALPWITLILVGWAATILFFASGRHRIPFLAGFLGPAGFGLALLLSQIRRRRLRPALLIVPGLVVLQLFLPAYPQEEAEAFDAYQLGLRHARLGRYEEALRDYREAVRLAPESGEAWHGIGAALASMNCLAEAAEAYEKAIEWIPESAVTRYNLGAVYGRLGDDAGALREFEEAVRLDPLEPSYRSDYAIALVRNGRVKEAIAQFRRVLDDHPGHASARRGLESLGVVP